MNMQTLGLRLGIVGIRDCWCVWEHCGGKLFDHLLLSQMGESVSPAHLVKDRIGDVLIQTPVLQYGKYASCSTAGIRPPNHISRQIFPNSVSYADRG